MNSPFEVLRIEPDADEEAIDRAFRRRAKETHPDQGGSASEFRSVMAAYEEIKSGNRRRLPDRGGEDPGDEGDGSGEEDRRTDPRVEYLNYDILDDFGWTIDDEDLFEKASTRDLDPSDHGHFTVESGESLLEAAESRGFTWPYSCRGGACANCAVAVTAGELSMPASHVLPQEMLDRGIQLSCVGTPATEAMRIVYNVKHLPDLDDLRLPPGPFERAHPDE